MVGFSISSWRNRFPPFDTLSCSVIIYCVNLEICDFYNFFSLASATHLKKVSWFSAKKPPKKTKNKKPPNDVIFQLRKKRYGYLFYYLRYIWRNEFKRTIVVTFSLGRKYMKRKEIECRFFVKKKKTIIIYMCMYVCHIQLIYKFIVVWFLKLS